MNPAAPQGWVRAAGLIVLKSTRSWRQMSALDGSRASEVSWEFFT